MSIPMNEDGFDALLDHVGHEIECAKYGSETVAWNVVVECITCGVVLVDIDNPVLAEESNT